MPRVKCLLYPLFSCPAGSLTLLTRTKCIYAVLFFWTKQLADLTIYVIDVAGGDKVPRKGGPGITQSDILIINKIDLAEAVGSDLSVMQRDAEKMRGGHGVEVPGPIVFAAVKHGTALPEIRDFVLDNFQRAMQVAAASKKE